MEVSSLRFCFVLLCFLYDFGARNISLMLYCCQQGFVKLIWERLEGLKSAIAFNLLWLLTISMSRKGSTRNMILILYCFINVSWNLSLQLAAGFRQSWTKYKLRIFNVFDFALCYYDLLMNLRNVIGFTMVWEKSSNNFS